MVHVRPHAYKQHLRSHKVVGGGNLWSSLIGAAKTFLGSETGKNIIGQVGKQTIGAIPALFKWVKEKITGKKMLPAPVTEDKVEPSTAGGSLLYDEKLAKVQASYSKVPSALSSEAITALPELSMMHSKAVKVAADKEEKLLSLPQKKGGKGISTKGSYSAISKATSGSGSRLKEHLSPESLSFIESLTKKR